MQVSFDVRTVAYYIMISVGYIMTLIFFFDRSLYKKHRRMHHFSFGLLVVWCILALISQPLVIKIYAVLSVVAVIVVETAIKKRRKKTDQPETAI
jgi:low temperature requirement protein LtrA